VSDIATRNKSSKLDKVLQILILLHTIIIFSIITTLYRKYQFEIFVTFKYSLAKDLLKNNLIKEIIIIIKENNLTNFLRGKIANVACDLF